MTKRPHRRSSALVFSVTLALILASCSPSQDSDSTSPSPAPPITPVSQWSPTGGVPLTEVPVVDSQDGLLQVTLNARRGVAEVAGSPVDIRGYNGTFIGPTLHLNPGDRLEVTLENETSQVTNIHYHGLHVSPSGISDNVLREMPPTQRPSRWSSCRRITIRDCSGTTRTCTGSPRDRLRAG